MFYMYSSVFSFLWNDLSCTSEMLSSLSGRLSNAVYCHNYPILSFFFFSLCPWGSVEQKLSEDKQNRGWCCCHGLAVNAPGLTAGARRKGAGENTEAERSGQNMKQKIVSSLTLLDRTVFCALCKLTRCLPTNRAEVFGQRALKRSQFFFGVGGFEL